MDIKSKVTGEKMEVVLSGVLDTRTAPELEKEVMGRIGEVNEIVFDFAELEYLTSAGLRILLAAQQEMEDKDGTMVLHNVNEDIMEVFDTTGFVDVLTIE